MTRSRALAAAAVLALHLGLWWAWREPPAPVESAALPQRAPLLLRLPPPPARPDDALPLPAIARRNPPPMPALEVPAIAALPADAPPAPAATAAPVQAMPAPAPPRPAPLVLELPRGASAPRRNPALDDPRANTARATLESRIAKATQKDWVEEVLGDGRTVWRRGDECVLVKPSRDAELDSFNQSSSHRPKQAGNC
jgi:hypothetical protein